MSDAAATDAAPPADAIGPRDGLRAELEARDISTARVFQLDLLARKTPGRRARRAPGIGSMYPSMKAR